MKIVVTGASGFVASELLPRLADAGHELILVSRDLDTVRLRYPNQLVFGYREWAEFSQSADLLLHLATLNNNAKGSEEHYRAANVKLTQDVAREAKNAGIQRFFYVSSVHTLRPGIQSLYAQSKLEGEMAGAEEFGPGFVSVVMGNVHGRSYSGALSILNRMPVFSRRMLFGFVAALRPTTSVGLLHKLLTEAKSRPNPYRVIVTDDKLELIAYRIWQQILNFGFIAFAALVAPAFLVIVLGIRIADGAPAMFSQSRLGKNGRVFTIFKLRTMRFGAKEFPTHLANPREITKLGWVLRKLKLDEFPQVVNVACGQMNLVGPRPSLISQKEVIESRNRLRSDRVVPGISGWAQVHGVDMSDPETLSKLDYEYSKLQSVLVDLQILVKTICGGWQKQTDVKLQRRMCYATSSEL